MEMLGPRPAHKSEEKLIIKELRGILKMRVVIAGSRTITDFDSVITLLTDISRLIEVSSVLNGMCPTGVDALALCWANECNIPVIKFPADWKAYGRAAGPLRNKQMAKEADCGVVIWDGVSKGSKNMIQELKKLGKPVYEFILTVKDEGEF
jgi:hypothetical protein